MRTDCSFADDNAPRYHVRVGYFIFLNCICKTLLIACVLLVALKQFMGGLFPLGAILALSDPLPPLQLIILEP